MYKIRVSRKKSGKSRASTVLKKENIGMQEMFDNLSMVLQSIDFTDCKVWISSTRNSWNIKRKDDPTLPFE